MRLYVTGGTGLVGSNIIRLARQRGVEIIASQYGPEPEWRVDYELDPLNLADHEAIRASIRQHKPDAVIHCAAILDQIFMFEQRELCWSIMVDGTRALAEACRDVGARLVFVSSDWVFDGLVDEGESTPRPYKETSPPNPVNFYGVMKLASERELAAMDGLNCGVGRLAGVYGLNYAAPSLARKENGLGFDFSIYVIDRLTAGLTADVWTGPKVNDVAHPTLASDCADMLLRLAEHDSQGGRVDTGSSIFHCCGSEAINRLDLAHQIAAAFAADPALIVPTPTDQAVLEEYRHIGIPYRTRMSTERTALALGRRAFNVREGLAAFREEWDEFWNCGVVTA
ncbi:MAG: sugar nucleotide-binding protein [Chloroflexi bacterium]|nr:sugar nucleotide-binding protein [Chloroflexota bacterium]